MKNELPEGYELDQSRLFRLSTRRKLAELLQVDLHDLEQLAAKGLANYRQFEHNDRWIETPLPNLKTIQRRIHDLLTRIKAPPYLFSAYKGRSSIKNAIEHDGAIWMVKTDIRKFYPSSHASWVYRLFHETFQCPTDVAQLLRDLTTIGPTPPHSNHPHLPTGGVTSPILAFFAYRDMFDQLHELSLQRGVKMTVMIDDVTFSGRNADQSLIGPARRIVEQFGIHSHWRKEKVWGPAVTKTVTGVVLTKKGPRVPNKQRKSITELREAIKAEEDPQKRTKLYQRLNGSLASAGQIEGRFKRDAKFLIGQWKSDGPAWSPLKRQNRKPPVKFLPKVTGSSQSPA